MTNSDFKNETTAADLYPDFSTDEQREAEYHLGRYLSVVKRILARAQRENPEVLTELVKQISLKKQGNNSPN